MKLALFFTKGVSLGIWEKVGNLDREVKPYKKLLDYFDEIYFLTYDNRSYLFEGIKVLPMSVFRKELKNIDIFKTNQMDGSWKAVIAKKIFKKKLVVRQGYQRSIFAQKAKTKKWKQVVIQSLEKFAYTNADAIIVSSKADKKYVEEKYKINPKKVNYIPNYIDTDLFKPLNVEKENRICFVGRLEDQKNLFNLIEAVKGLDIKLTIFGTGSLKDKLTLASSENIEFKENINNKDLPGEINKSRLFILPSLYEGCPKVLLEAMSCGVPVIGTNVYGIDEIIKHKENGYLCETSVESIRSAIMNILDDNDLQKRMGLNARRTILENFSLDKVLKKEKSIYETLR